MEKPISEFQNPVQRQAQLEQNTKPDKSFPSAKPSVSSRREAKVRFSPSSVSERKVEEEQSERENIVIIDNITDPAKFVQYYVRTVF